MSQKALGQRLEVSYQQIQKYENGTTRVNAVALLTICAALGIEVAAIYGGLVQELAGNLGMSEIPQETYTAVWSGDDTLRRLNEAFEKISEPRDRESVAYLAERLAAIGQDR